MLIELWIRGLRDDLEGQLGQRRVRHGRQKLISQKFLTCQKTEAKLGCIVSSCGVEAVLVRHKRP
jgi:hypothetical protein